MTFFSTQLTNLSEQISSLQTQLEQLEKQKNDLKLEEQDFTNAFQYLEGLLERHQDNPEILECVRSQFDELFSRSPQSEPELEPQPEPQLKSEPEPQPVSEPVPEAENSVCLYRNPSVFWDSHADSMRMFLYTKEDARATGEKVVELKLATRYNVSPIDSESFCLTLSGVQLRQTADRILEIWLEDESEDMAEPVEQLADIEPVKNFHTHHSTLKFESQEEAELFGRHAVDRNIISSYSAFSDGQVQIFGVLDEQEFNKYKIEFDLASEDPIELKLCDRQAAEKFSQELLERGLASEFEIDDEGCLQILDPKEPEEILRLLEEEPLPKSWLNDQAYYRNDCLIIGFKTKKLRNEWAKFFDIPLGGNASIEPMDSSLISGLKVSLKIVFYSGIEKSLERIQEFDFTLTPEENESHLQQKSEEIGVQFSHEPIDTNCWMLYAKRPFEEKVQLAGCLFLNGKYKVPNLYNREFDTLDLAAEALWHHRNAS